MHSLVMSPSLHDFINIDLVHIFLNQAHAWFPEITFPTSVCLCMCVCVSTPEAINN